jgi:hypothetical protein
MFPSNLKGSCHKILKAVYEKNKILIFSWIFVFIFPQIYIIAGSGQFFKDTKVRKNDWRFNRQELAVANENCSELTIFSTNHPILVWGKCPFVDVVNLYWAFPQTETTEPRKSLKHLCFWAKRFFNLSCMVAFFLAFLTLNVWTK